MMKEVRDELKENYIKAILMTRMVCTVKTERRTTKNYPTVIENKNMYQL